MKTLLTRSLLAVFVVVICRAAPVDEVAAAARKLGDVANYSWTRTDANARPPGPAGIKVIEGVTEKDGFTVSRAKIKGVVIEETVRKGEQSVTLRPDGTWRTAEEMRAKYFDGKSVITVQGGGVGNGGRIEVPTDRIRDASAASAPSTPTTHNPNEWEILDLLGQVKTVNVVGGVFVGELTDDGVARRFGGVGPDGQPNRPRDASGTAKFWIKDGAIVQYEIHAKAAIQGASGPTNLERTITVEIKKVGTTAVTVPAAARARFGE